MIGDGGNEEGVENDYTVPQAAWSAYRDLAFGQASFVIMNETSAEWAWRADDGTPIDQVWDPQGPGCMAWHVPCLNLSDVLAYLSYSGYGVAACMHLILTCILDVNR